MDRIDSLSLNLEKNNIDKIKQLFPEAVEEGKINFEMLRAMLGDDVDDSKEKYQFTWNGKAKSIKLAQTPSSATLRPCKEKSKNWDKTENLYIEGDNLEVLKQLQKTYYGKIKMIYIDPPYNTGKDFIYPDNFQDSITNYIELTKQTNSSNKETSGRYHTDWLNMMYPRILLAKNLLKDDGCLFISIDEKEIVNLTNACNEVFGEENHLETFHMQVRYSNKSLNEDSDFQPVMEYILIYAKNRDCFVPQKPSEPYDLSKFCWNIEELSQGETIQIANKTVTIFKDGEWKISKAEEGKIGLLKETWASGSIVKQSGTAAEFLAKYLIDRKSEDGLSVLYKIHNMGEDGLGYRYVTGPTKPDAIRGKFYSGVPLTRVEEINKGTAVKFKPITNYYDYSADFGNIRQEGGIAFNSGKKPIKMIEKLIEISNVENNDIILDFFSGSASTAHALMDYCANNYIKNFKLNFLMVQLPELISEKEDAFRQGFRTICDLGEERIRRAGEQIKAEWEKEHPSDGLFGSDEEFKTDIGFKVFKLDSTNVNEWDPNMKLDEKELAMRLGEVFKEDRSKEDILYEIMLKYGVFDKQAEEINVNGKTMYHVGKRYMIVCLNEHITSEDVKAIGELSPRTVIFNEAGFNNDNDKINAVYNLEKAGVEDVKCI